MSFLDHGPLLGGEGLHLGLLPQLVEVLLVLEDGHVLDVARAHALLFRLLVALDRLPRPPDSGLVPVGAAGLVGRVGRGPGLRFHRLFGDPLRFAAYHTAAVF